MIGEIEIAKLIVEHAPNISTNAILLSACGYLFWANKQLLKEFKSVSELILKNSRMLEQMENNRNQAREHDHLINQAIKDELKELKFELREHTQSEIIAKNSYMHSNYGQPFTRGKKRFDRDFENDC